MDPARVRIVLLRTHDGKNLGAVARVLKNFGFTRLILADLGPVDFAGVNQMAVQSQDVIASAQRATSLEAALEGCVWVVGTTMRRLPGQRDLTPRQVAAEATERVQEGDIALVFGEERIGLTNQDLLVCHDVSVIPTTDALRSLNLAQAVLVYVWELFNGVQAPQRPPAARAQQADYQRLELALRAHLQRGGFADPDRPRHGAKDLIQTLMRAGLTVEEAKLWEAVLRKS